ncbi:NUDIX domain-containing protein [Flavobacteriaceae bacterium F08102]|nr:NUDIX domain-containing protein [Flavobacteriaceae bacterium F08102]
MKHELRRAVMGVLVHNDKVLIGSSPRDGGYKFPQGGLEPNEHYLDGIKRELKEELGLELDQSAILDHFDETVGYDYPDEDRYIFKRQELHVVLIQYHPTMKLEPQDDEFDELLWINPNELHKFPTYFRAQAYQRALELCKLY